MTFRTLLALTLGAVPAVAQSRPDPMLVTTAWVAEHLRDPDLVLLHVGPRTDYDSLHVPGARFVQLGDVTVRDGVRVFEIPGAAQLDSTLEAMGIGDDARIVVYQSSDWFSPATRVYLTLVWAGLGDRTSLMDGGFAAWRRERRPVTADVPVARRATLTLHPRTDVVVTADWVASHLQDPRVAVLDARNERFYLGHYATRPEEPRVGHIPGAFNVPFGSVVDSLGYLKRPEELRDLFRSVRADAGDTVVTYCHIGQQATLLWFGARLAGYAARLYDGSFTEWSNLSRYPVEP